MKSTLKNELSGVNKGCLFALLVFLCAILLLNNTILLASPINRGKADKFVKNWLKSDTHPLGSRLGNEIETIETHTDQQGQPLYYAVYLRPNGFIIIAADDDVEPVICFSSKGNFIPDENNPLGAMISKDLPQRMNIIRSLRQKINAANKLSQQENALRDSIQKAGGKWSKILADSDQAIPDGIGSVSDVRVSPLIQSRWDQMNVCSSACYNYYTPPYANGSASNHPSGCVATAMAQYMRFWQYPAAGVGTSCFTIYVNGSSQLACLRGGDGTGGPYDFNQMPFVPDCTTTLPQREAIGAITSDAGIAVQMQYDSASNGGSGAYMSDADSAMTQTFLFDNCIFGSNGSSDLGAILNTMINPNLDSGNPVILGILGGNFPNYYGHAILADGYGYQSSTLYHHLNLGWSGSQDAWYNLPNIDSSPSFNIIDSALYNIYTTGSGEIISGRVIDDTNQPLAGAIVTAVKTGDGSYEAVTNDNGIYAFTKIPSNSSYTISVFKDNYSFTSHSVSTGLSRDNMNTTGNCWGVDFSGRISVPSPPAIADYSVSLENGIASPFILQASDEGLPEPPGILQYIVTELPRYGTLADPCGELIENVPYTLLNNSNTVIYTPNICNPGTDSLQFKANDGGTPPDGGDSNIATVSITILPLPPQIIYETGFDSGLPAGWTIVDAGGSADTWQSDNPRNRTSSYWTGIFMLVDSDLAGYVNMDEELITQNINCSNLSSVTLRFKHYFKYYADELADVDVKVNGAGWQNIARYQGSDADGLVEIPLSSFGADNSSNVQIRWHYYNAYYDWFWGIDDVQIIGNPAQPVHSIGDLNFDCIVDYNDLYVLALSWLSGTGQSNWNPDADISGPADGLIDFLDFAVFAQNWLQ